ncbi:IclR family transcriptional regulator C-terminal domain-containing protein, partial [Burkholderia sp. SIMBA_024]
MSLFHTGSGHVLLAFQTEAQREIMITEQVRGSGETVPPDLAGRLAEVRKNGFESMDSLQTAGVRNISAPVLTL